MLHVHDIDLGPFRIHRYQYNFQFDKENLGHTPLRINGEDRVAQTNLQQKVYVLQLGMIYQKKLYKLYNMW